MLFTHTDRYKYLLCVIMILFIAAYLSILMNFRKNSPNEQLVLLNRRGHCGFNMSTKVRKSIHMSYGSANLLLTNLGAEKDKIVFGLADHPYLISIENLSDCDIPGYTKDDRTVLDDYTIRIREASKVVDISNSEVAKVSDIHPFNSEYDIGNFEDKPRIGFWRRTRILKSNLSGGGPSLIAVCDYGSSIKNNICSISTSPACFPGLIFTMNGVEEVYLDQSEKIRIALDNIALRLLDHNGMACP